jgi:DNA polymerase-3 subunit delta'
MTDKLSHHAYVIETERTSDFLSCIESHSGISATGNSDVFVLNTESLAIDDARNAIERAYYKPRGEKNVIILAADFVSPITQNALLKVMEEPPAHTVLYLVVPTVSSLLPTLRSRVQILQSENTESSSKVLAKKIMKASLAERLELIKPLYDNDEDEKKKGEALHLLNALQELLLDKQFRPKDQKQYAATMRMLEQSRKDLLQTGAMMKMIMEAVVLSI